jgi:hypothetical protein
MILSLLLGAFAVHAQTAADDAHVLSVIHRKLANPYRVKYNSPIIFVRTIAALGPIYQGVCKEGINENVDFTVEMFLWGDPHRTTIQTSYINCTGVPLPSPPFSAGSRLIVYCERPQDAAFQCLNPVPYSDATAKEIYQWTAAIKPIPTR